MAGDQKKDPKGNNRVIMEFQQLRNEQRNLVNNMNTMEMDLKEHIAVIETLKTVEQDRKCFRLIGGVLCERTVKDVLPQLIQNREFIEKKIVTITEQLTKKGIEINKYKEEHNIKIRGEEMSTDSPKPDSDKTKENRTVLVSSN